MAERVTAADLDRVADLLRALSALVPGDTGDDDLDRVADWLDQEVMRRVDAARRRAIVRNLKNARSGDSGGR